MTGRLLRSCSQRESVCCRRPVSNASCRALIASLPVRRASIFRLNAKENGFVTRWLPSRPADQPRERATTILTLGARMNCYPCVRNTPWDWLAALDDFRHWLVREAA
jgi:hypothetical protein